MATALRTVCPLAFQPLAHAEMSPGQSFYLAPCLGRHSTCPNRTRGVRGLGIGLQASFLSPLKHRRYRQQSLGDCLFRRLPRATLPSISATQTNQLPHWAAVPPGVARPVRLHWFGHSEKIHSAAPKLAAQHEARCLHQMLTRRRMPARTPERRLRLSSCEPQQTQPLHAATQSAQIKCANSTIYCCGFLRT